jgi:hypothetical protein
VVGEEAEMEKKVVAASELVRTAEVETEKKVMIASKSVWAAGIETEKKVTALESVRGGGQKRVWVFVAGYRGGRRGGHRPRTVGGRDGSDGCSTKT